MHCHCNLCSVLWWQSFVLSQKACHSCVNKAKGIERGVWGSKDVESNSRRPSVMLHLRAKREVWRKNCLTVIHPISRCSGWRYHCPSLSALVLEITVSKVEKLLAWVSWVTVLFKYTIVQFAYVLCINSTFVYMMCFGSACINTCTDKIVKAAAIFLQIWYVKKKATYLHGAMMGINMKWKQQSTLTFDLPFPTEFLAYINKIKASEFSSVKTWQSWLL